MGSTGTISHADPGGAARAVLTVLADHQRWGEDHAQLAPEAVQALAEAGLFRLVAPVEVGGWEATLPQQLEVYETLASVDVSAAWCVTNAAVAGRIAAYLDDDTRAEVFSDPGASYAFSNLAAGRLVDEGGGVRVSGRWSVVSGCTHAAWAVLGARPGGDGDGPGDADDPHDAEVRWLLVPAADMIIERSWDEAVAMRGTGSHTVVVDAKPVPAGFVHRWSNPLRLDRTLYRVGHTSVTGSASAAMALGVLGAAVDSLVEVLASYTSELDGARPRDWPNVAEAVASLTAARRAARAGLFDAGAAVWTELERRGEVPPRLRAELFAAADHAVQVSLSGVSRAFVCGTGRALRRGHPLERALRDAHGMAINWERLRRMIFDAGRVVAGGEPRYRAM